MKLHLPSAFFVLLCVSSAEARLGNGERQQRHRRRHRKLRMHADTRGDLESEFIVVLDDSIQDVGEAARSMAEQTDCRVGHVFTNLFKGFSATGMATERLTAMLDDTSILYATPNKEIKGEFTQENPPWNLDRIDEQAFPLNDRYTTNYDGTGVTVFILDTGIRTTHLEFDGRASCGYNAFDRFESCEDFNSHGTNVAGIVGGTYSGVAKNVKLEAVKVLNSRGVGSVADTLAGIDYVVGRKRREPNTPMVLNMSLGGPAVAIENQMVNAAVDAGIVVVAAAGNEGSNACYSSPASAEKAITVGATSARGFFWTTLDALAGFSNVGTCVDIFAPGTRIPGPWAGDDVNGIVADGTSQAAPHVAGAAALYLQKHPNWTPAQVWEAMRADSLKGTIFYLGFGNSPNRLLNVAKI